MGTGVRKARVDMAEHAMMSQGSPLLMQHATFGDQEDGNESGRGRGRGRKSRGRGSENARGRGRGRRNGRGSEGQEGED